MSRIAKPSCQSLLIQMRFNGNLLSTGTAFIANASAGPVLITNRHNVTGLDQHSGIPLSKTGGVPSEITVTHNRKGHLGQWVPRVEPLFDGATPRWYEHPALGARADFVALRLTQLEDVECYAHDVVNVGPDLFVGPSDPVSVIGFPFGVTAGGKFGIWATGFLASEPTIDFEDLPKQLVDCRTRPGQSGSPVIAYRSGGLLPLVNGDSEMFNGPVYRFIGVYSGRINVESDLGIVWKASAIQELLQSL